MSLYSYTAKNKDGNIYEGELETQNKIELFRQIHADGGKIISIKELKSDSSVWGFFGGLFSGIKTHDKIIFAKNLGSMISAGLSVTRSLEVMEKQTKNKSLKALLHKLSVDVSKGEPLSDALKRRADVFSPLFISMVRAGEESGNLAGALGIVASQMDKSYALVKKIRGAMIYPAVILGIMVILTMLLLIYMVPTLTATFQGIGIELPLSTRIIIAMSTFLIDHTILVLSGIVFLLLLGFSFWKSESGRNTLDYFSLHAPLIGNLVKEANSARTARTLSSLLSSGVPILNAFGVTIDVMQNHLYKEALDKARTAVQKGDPVSLVFEEYQNLYPPFVAEMVSVGEETGKISEMLLGVATYYEDEVEEKTKDLSTIIEPLLMVVIGAGVGIFAISMLAPTYSLVNNI